MPKKNNNQVFSDVFLILNFLKKLKVRGNKKGKPLGAGLPLKFYVVFTLRTKGLSSPVTKARPHFFAVSSGSGLTCN